MATSSAAGANLPPGLAAALASAPPGAPAVLEVDEGYLGTVADAVAPEVVVLLNLSRDQLDRVSEVRMVADRWRAGAVGPRSTTVVANADDPLVVWGAQGRVAEVIWVAAGQLWRQRRRRVPGVRGPDRLRADGDWSVRCAGFARPRPDAVADAATCSSPPTGAHLPSGLALPGPVQPGQRRHGRRGRRRRSGSTRPTRSAPMASVADVEGRFATVRPRRRHAPACCWPRTRPDGPSSSTCSTGAPTRS